MKIIFVYPHVNSIGGVEVAILRLIKKLYNKYDFTVGFMYEDSDTPFLLRFSEYANVVNLTYNKTQEYDICVYCSLWSPKEVKAKRYLRWVHGCIKDMKYTMNREPDIEEYIAVGNTCAIQIKEQINAEPIIIFNELDADIKKLSKVSKEVAKDVVTLCTVSRISQEKGFERMLEVSKRLKSSKVKYVWNIVGEGYDKSYEKKIKALAPKEWVFHGVDHNPYPYMAESDYLVQMSDFEAFGYVMLESLTLGTPVITTNYESSSEMIQHGVNGFIVDKSLNNFDVSMVSEKLEFKHKYKTDSTKWEKIWQKGM